MNYPWGHSRRFNTYSDYMRNIFGERVQKLTIDAGFSCPNRDGSKGTGGCTFCLNEAFNPSYCSPDKSIAHQIREGIAFHENRYRRATKYLAYFQTYSNTYASVDKLYQIYKQALDVDGVIGIVIGTRPDCINTKILKLLKGISANYHVMVEYGIESVYNKTLQKVNRCHTFEDSIDAIELTAANGIPVGGHMIIGLPGESREEILQGANILSRLPLTSVKFHQLQLFKGTRMAEEYLTDPAAFHLFEKTEYLNLMVEFIEHLNPRIVVERIAGETPPRFALQQPWGPRYDQLLKEFETLLEQRNSWQGKHYKQAGSFPN